VAHRWLRRLIQEEAESILAEEELRAALDWIGKVWNVPGTSSLLRRRC